MIAWDLLIVSSTAPVSSIAWVHLNSQNGGGCSGLGDADIKLSDGSEKLTMTAKSETINFNRKC